MGRYSERNLHNKLSDRDGHDLISSVYLNLKDTFLPLNHQFRGLISSNLHHWAYNIRTYKSYKKKLPSYSTQVGFYFFPLPSLSTIRNFILSKALPSISFILYLLHSLSLPLSQYLSSFLFPSPSFSFTPSLSLPLLLFLSFVLPPHLFHCLPQVQKKKSYIQAVGKSLFFFFSLVKISLK